MWEGIKYCEKYGGHLIYFDTCFMKNEMAWWRCKHIDHETPFYFYFKIKGYPIMLYMIWCIIYN